MFHKLARFDYYKLASSKTSLCALLVNELNLLLYSRYSSYGSSMLT